MAFDGSRRISAAEALQHRYFRTEPLPSGVDQLPKPRGRQPEGGGNGAAGERDTAAGGGAGAGAGGAAEQPQPQQQSDGGSGGAGGAAGGGANASTTQPAADAGQPNGQAAGARPTPTPPFGGRPLSAIPESLLGRGERPKLDSSDVAFFKKRKFNLDDALDEEENAQAVAS